MSDRTIVVRKNRLWGWWALAMIAMGLPFSAWFVYLGLRPGRGGTGWMLATFGLLGMVAFGAYGRMVIGTLRAPWRLEVSRSYLALFAPGYDLRVSWERVAGIAVAEVNRRLGCVLVFDDVAAVTADAVFHRRQAPAGAVTDAGQMLARMQESFRDRGYHLGIPERVLELKPEALARLLAQAKSGDLWREVVE